MIALIWSIAWPFFIYAVYLCVVWRTQGTEIAFILAMWLLMIPLWAALTAYGTYTFLCQTRGLTPDFDVDWLVKSSPTLFGG